MKVKLDVKTADGKKTNVVLRCYVNHVNAEIGRRFREAVIICSGGAYAFRSETEGEYVAVKYQACGMQAFVLDYSVQVPFPQALLELAAAVQYIRKYADVLDVNPERVMVCGFSAGAHLAASLGVFWNHELLRKIYPDVRSVRPDGLILCYPVITAGEYAHKESIANIAGMMSEEEQAILSLENQVSEDMPEVFLWHTLDDDTVPVENTLEFVHALREHKVPFELHIFPSGKHGLSLATEFTAVSEDHINESVAQWFDLAITWIKAGESR